MTAYKWDEMTPQERNVLVAQKVMKWQWTDNWNRSMLLPPQDSERFNWTGIWDDDGIPHYLPSYTVEIKDAWEVVERMKRNGWLLSVECSSSSLYWIATFVDRTRYPKGSATAPTAPEAISLAALRAVGVDVV